MWTPVSIAPWTRCSDWGLVNQPDRVLIWSSQLRANDFPPVCAMTGAPAETWHKFRFVTVPGWAYAFLILLCTGIGLLPIFIILAVVSRRAAGYLPLTRSSRTRIRLATWVPFALIPIAFAMWIAAAIIGSAAGSGGSPGATGDSIGSGIATALLLLGILTVLGGCLDSSCCGRSSHLSARSCRPKPARSTIWS